MSAIIGQDIKKAAHYLNSNDVVAIPTETVYGLAANALDINAVTKIFEVKNRPYFDPLIVHISALNEINKYAKTPHPELIKLAEAFWPGPLTILFDKKDVIPDLVTSGLSRVALRMPNHELTLQLLQNIDFPLAAPSANPFSYVSPTCAQHVHDQLGEKIPYILDGGACDIGLESSIVGMEGENLMIYRKGGLEIERIREIFKGKIIVNDNSSSSPAAPGMLKKHYSPNKIMLDYKDYNPMIHQFDNIGFLKFSEYEKNINSEQQIILSENANLSEAAQRLFGALRSLDKLDIDTIFIEFVPEIGLGLAINDRLKRTLTDH